MSIYNFFWLFIYWITALPVAELAHWKVLSWNLPRDLPILSTCNILWLFTAKYSLFVYIRLVRAVTPPSGGILEPKTPRSSPKKRNIRYNHSQINMSPWLINLGVARCNRRLNFELLHLQRDSMSMLIYSTAIESYYLISYKRQIASGSSRKLTSWAFFSLFVCDIDINFVLLDVIHIRWRLIMIIPLTTEITYGM